MSETFRTESNEIVRREDDGYEELFTEKEYEQTSYQDTPEEKIIEKNEERDEKVGATVNKVAIEKEIKESKGGHWWQKGQYE